MNTEKIFDDDTLEMMYKMKIHDQITPDTPHTIVIYRVPGGWLYVFFDHNSKTSTTFVPFCQFDVSEMRKYYEKEIGNLTEVNL